MTVIKKVFPVICIIQNHPDYTYTSEIPGNQTCIIFRLKNHRRCNRPVRHFSRAPQKPEEYSLTEAIRQTKADLDCAYINFDHALDPDLIDCYIYQLKSAQMRYRFLLNCVKKDGTP